MKLLKRYKLKASSLVETIVATVISTICLSIAVLVFVQVSSTTDNLITLKASQVLHMKMYEDWIATSIEDDIVKEKGFTFERKVISSKEQNQWKEITYKITTRQKVKNQKQLLEKLTKE